MPRCILAIETSTPHGQVAVWREGVVVFDSVFRSQRSHNSQLFGPLGEALDVCGKDLESIVVGTGPGSYTGVRIGIAAAQGLGWSRGVPVFGLPSVLAPDLEVIPPAFTVCGDARRTQFYAARVQDGCLAAGAIPLMDAGALAALHESDGGSCWITFDEKIPAHLEGVRCVRPSASHLATLASRFSGEELRARGAAALEPVYLSAPFITQAKKR